MPIFTFANAGVPITAADFGQPISLAIFVSLGLGTPVGVFGFGLAVRGSSLSWPFPAAGAFPTGIGFTMSLFIAGLAYSPTMLNAAKLGVLAGSVVSAVTRLAMLVWLTIRRRTT
ncbi:Sodium/proton antiporter NhaA [Hartmannibacter diazotrophicus]|uniref:Putative Na(+)/H(+) antiporter NhaA homolog n=1 Tax=Hartmannibacter diazotrophicus TaxID=1482074 RepID=A0A2C9D292_9HYPH|nr:Sodium/proton antiporter NhaA [Hartmannibacter diazotrophicus]